MKTDRKMSGFKRIASLFLALMIVLSLVPLQPLHVHAAAPSLKITNAAGEETDTFLVGDPVYVTGSGYADSDWFALWKIPGDGKWASTYMLYIYPDDEPANLFDGVWTGEAASAWDGMLLEPGEYGLFLNNGSDATATFTVNEPNDQTKEIKSLEVEETTVSYGESIKVTATNYSEYSWVGIYSGTHSSRPSAGSLDFYYCLGREGVTKEWVMPSGDYTIVMYDDYDGDQTTTGVDNFIHVTVEESVDPELATNKTEYTYGEDILVSTNYSSGGKDWVGIYKKGETYDPDNGGEYSILWYYIADKGVKDINILDNSDANGRLVEFVAGEYTISLFTNDTYTSVATVDITVKAEEKKDTEVKVEPTCTVNGSITYTMTDGGTKVITDKNATYTWPETAKTAPVVVESEKDTSLKALDHLYGDAVPNYEEDFGNKGDNQTYTHTRTCTRENCGAEVKGHTVTVPCTWGEGVAGDGFTTYTCTADNCGGKMKHVEKEVQSQIEVEATCTQQGYTEILYVGESEPVRIAYTDALGHDFTGAVWSNVEGTNTHICSCTPDGYECDKGDGWQQTAKCVSKSAEIVGAENAVKFICDDCGNPWSEKLLSLDKELYKAGDSVFVTVNAVYKHALSGTKEWVGVYKKGAEMVDGNELYYEWLAALDYCGQPFAITSAGNGQWGIWNDNKKIEAGEYTIALFSSNYNLVTSIDFTVHECKDVEPADHKCDICDYTMSTCVDTNPKDHICDICKVAGMGDFHEAVEGSHNCAYCGKSADKGCVDENPKDHKCDVCGAGNMGTHAGTATSHNCAYCGQKASNCIDDNKDHKCDVCKAELSKCADNNSDHKCDVCKAELSKCADANSDHKCDVCKAELSKCADGNSDHKCDTCKAELSKCADGNSDHKCDVCKAELSKCADGNSDHKCDVCKAELSKCADGNSDHKCDVCKAELSKCADANSDHKCDVCKAELSKCADANKDYKCDVCGKELEKPEEPKDEEPKEEPKEEEPAPEDPKEEEPEEKPEEPTVNQPVGVGRLAGNTRYDTAFQAADELKKVTGKTMFDAVIVSSGEQFADALAGSYLAAVKGAPILLMKDRNKEINAVKEYIKANVNPGGTVYLLGGVNAVPAKMETGLEGFNVKRLGGNDRYATNLLILEEAGVAGKDVVVCTGKDFADSLSASAVGLPILLVKDKLNDKQLQFMAGCTGKIYVIGGVNAVSARVESQLKSFGNVERLAGNTRYDTSALVAKTFFSNPTSLVLAYGKNFPDGLSGGPVAFAMGAPLILTEAGKEKVAAAYVAETGIQNGYVQGGTAVLPEKTVNKVFGK